MKNLQKGSLFRWIDEEEKNEMEELYNKINNKKKID